MSNSSGFDYDVFISRLYGGVRAFQSLRAHRRQRDQPPVPTPDERPVTPPPRTAPEHHDEPAAARVATSLEPQAFAAVNGRVVPLFIEGLSPAPEGRQETPPPRSAQPLPNEPGEMRAATPLEPQGFISMNGRIVPLFGELGAGMFARPAPAGAASPSAGERPPAPPQSTAAGEIPSAQPQSTATPAPVETRSSPLPSAPAPTSSPLRLPPPTPPARLGLIRGVHPHSAATDPASRTASSEVPASPGPGTPTSTNTDGASLAALTALLDTHAKDEALRLERVHAEHRSFVEILLRDHREALRAQSEAHAAQTAQLHRDVLTEHRAELARVAQAHADDLAQVLSQHRQEAPNQRAHTPPDDELRSALMEHSRCQREANQDIAEHIGALTTIVADLGQTVGMMAMAAVHPSNSALAAPVMATAERSEPTAAPSAPVTTDSVDPRPTLSLAEPGSRLVRASLEATALPGASTAASATASDRACVLQCVGDDWKQVNLGVSGDGGGPPARAPIAVREEPDGGGEQAE